MMAESFSPEYVTWRSNPYARRVLNACFRWAEHMVNGNIEDAMLWQTHAELLEHMRQVHEKCASIGRKEL